MNNVSSTIDLSVLPDSTLHLVAKKIVKALAEKSDIIPATFSLLDLTKAIANFHTASTNAKEGDVTSLAIYNLSKEALVSVLYVISDQKTIQEKIQLSLH